MASQIEKISKQFLDEAMSRNDYQKTKSYDSNHSNAISDGDDKGKGENNGKVGSSTDINTRIDSLGRNKYGPNFGYGIENTNALSDGDEFGRGERNGEVGTITDQNKRKEHPTL